MFETIADLTYLLERTFPQLNGAGAFFLGTLVVATVFLLMFLFTRKRIHLVVTLAALAYVLPFVL
jgi:hypothetical protein